MLRITFIAEGLHHHHQSGDERSHGCRFLVGTPLEKDINLIHPRCLQNIESKIERWQKLGRFQAFSQQHTIKQDIEACHDAISDCLTRFNVGFIAFHLCRLTDRLVQLTSQNEILEWQTEFARTARQDHADVVEYLSDIQHSQHLFKDAQQEQTGVLMQMVRFLDIVLGLLSDE